MSTDVSPSEFYEFCFSKTAKNSLNIAKADLMAAKILFSNGLYPASVFHLQQCVEKGYKSYNFFIGSIDEKGAKRKISHKASDLRYVIDNFHKERFETFIKDSQIDPNKKKLIDSVFQIDSSKEIPQWKKNHLPFLDRLRNIHDNHSVPENLIKSAMSEIHNCHIRMMETKISTYSIKYHDIIQKEINGEIPCPYSNFCTPQEAILLFECLKTQPEQSIFGDYQEAIKNNLEISFEILSLLLDPHAVDSRYQRDNFSPLVFYTKKLPLIKKFEKLCNLTEINLEFFEKFVTDCNDFQKNGKLIKNYNFDIPVQDSQ